MRRVIVCVAAAIIFYQILIPPVAGIADQGDFRRIIGRFGYGPQQHDLNMWYVAPKYVPDKENRVPEWEQFASEYLFVAAALGLNKVISKDGGFDITVMGFVHAVTFLAAFAYLLSSMRRARFRVALWTGAILILTDVAYVAYFNTFYAEPAALIFLLLLIGESIELWQGFSPAKFARWTLWAVLFALAKPLTAVPALLAGIFALRFRAWHARAAAIGSAAIVSAALVTIIRAPTEMRNACTYNLVFKAILPESKDPAADLKALGLDPRLQDYARSGPWSADTIYPALEESGAIGRTVTQAAVWGFYLARPARLWKHIHVMLPVAMNMRPPYGNFEPSSGLPAGAQSRAFALWSGFHERVLSRVSKFVLFLLPVPAIVVSLRWRRRTLQDEFAALLGLCALVAFVAAIFGDAWDDTKHLFLFNFLTDAFLLWSAMRVWNLATEHAPGWIRAARARRLTFRPPLPRRA